MLLWIEVKTFYVTTILGDMAPVKRRLWIGCISIWGQIVGAPQAAPGGVGLSTPYSPRIWNTPEKTPGCISKTMLL